MQGRDLPDSIEHGATVCCKKTCYFQLIAQNLQSATDSE